MKAAGFRKKEQKDLDRLDFLRITDLCQKYKIIKSKELRGDVNKVRELRSRLRIGGLLDIETIPAHEENHAVLREIYENEKSTQEKDFEKYLERASFDGGFCPHRLHFLWYQ